MCPARYDVQTIDCRFLRGASASLTLAEESALSDCEAVIGKGRASAFDEGNAFIRIRDQQLYRATHQTFEIYFRQKWNYGKSQVYRLIGAADVLRYFSPIGDIPKPTHESQVRPLFGLAESEVIAGWRKAVELAKGNRITARLVRRAAIEIGVLKLRHHPGLSAKERLARISALVQEANDESFTAHDVEALREILNQIGNLAEPAKKQVKLSHPRQSSISRN